MFRSSIPQGYQHTQGRQIRRLENILINTKKSSLLLLLIEKHLTQKESYSMKMDLLTKVTVVNGAILFVSGKSKENVKPSSEDDKEESNEPDYNKDQDQLQDSKEEQWKCPTKFSNKVHTIL
ncbi:MAG: hypothetical protein ACJ72S_01000 [Nitrososphaeraceae archaeon]